MILLLDASPRKNANSEIIVDTLARDLADCEPVVFKMREKNIQYCLYCDACRRHTQPFCARQDDLTALLPVLDACDALLVASPVFDHQVSSLAKMFLERLYAFYDETTPEHTRVRRRNKKVALALSCWTGPVEVYKKYADWTLEGFWQVGAGETRSEVFSGLHNAGEIAADPDAIARVHALGKWLRQPLPEE